MTVKTLLATVVLTFVGLFLAPHYFVEISLAGLALMLLIVWIILSGQQHELNRAKWERLNEGQHPLGTSYHKYEGL